MEVIHPGLQRLVGMLHGQLQVGAKVSSCMSNPKTGLAEVFPSSG
jgi:hypothetical protein